jgi:hypothetical protein
MAWRVPPIWEGGECWILGGGPSLPRQFDVPEEIIAKVLAKELPLSAYSPYMQAIHNKHVIGVNMAFMFGDWVDMVFWGDKKWYYNNREKLAKFRGIKITSHPHFNNQKYALENIKYIHKDGNHAKGISFNSNMVSWNANSGAAAVSIGANTGAKRIILVGFDMKLGVDNKQHWHSEYGTSNRKVTDPKKLPFYRHMLGFSQMQKDAKKRGIQIINACPDSAINEFPKMTVKELLNGQEN